VAQVVGTVGSKGGKLGQARVGVGELGKQLHRAGVQAGRHCLAGRVSWGTCFSKIQLINQLILP
jgi:hypothetical protein